MKITNTFGVKTLMKLEATVELELHNSLTGEQLARLYQHVSPTAFNEDDIITLGALISKDYNLAKVISNTIEDNIIKYGLDVTQWLKDNTKIYKDLNDVVCDDFVDNIIYGIEDTEGDFTTLTRVDVIEPMKDEG